MKKKLLPLVAVSTFGLLFSGPIEGWAQHQGEIFNTESKNSSPTVQVNWNRYYDYAGITEICARLAKAYPNLVKMETIGDSFEGRRIWALTISDFTTGDPDRKPAMYIDGNIHANPTQASEYALYTAWYLLENFHENAFIRELLQQKTFYILPSINPDARDHFMLARNTTRSAHAGMIPVDDDRDGLVNEDPSDDLNQDGYITLMRRKSPQGRYIKDPKNPLRLMPAKPGQPGEYELLGYESKDNDRDGKLNEDPAGYYDPSRDWAWNWQPDYIQTGAYKYPFSLPETRAVKDFIMLHPNIAGAQNYHTSSELIFIGPETEEDQNVFTPDDLLVYNLIAAQAKHFIPNIGYQVHYKDVNPGYGGELAWLHNARGIFTFSNQLMSPLIQVGPTSAMVADLEAEQEELTALQLANEAYVKWKPYKHPILGAIEIGGLKKNFAPASSETMIEKDAHRNMVFSLYQAFQLPQLVIQGIEVKKLPKGLTEISATIENTRLIPTRSNKDVNFGISQPDYVTLKDSTVVSGMVMHVGEQVFGKEQQLNPARLLVPYIPGKGNVKVKWVVKAATPNLTIEVDSRRGGVVSKGF